MIYYPSLTRVVPLTTIQRERLLPAVGEVLVEAGAHVEPMSIVARAEVSGRYHILNVSQALGVSPDDVEKYVRVKIGRPVEAGQVVASRRVGLGLIPRTVRAPREGMVVAVGGGRVLLETAGEPIEVNAYVPGTVSNILPKMGVLVETVGALVQGVWGSGGEAFGVLKMVVGQHDEPLRARSIDVSCHGAVLVGGSTTDEAALQQAAELLVRGIVIGSLDATLIEVAQEMPFPIIATEGLGRASMAPPLFRLLRTNEGREAAISGKTQPRWGAIRPEVIIPLPAQMASMPPSPGARLDVGAQVRVIGGPALGEVGTVDYLPMEPLRLETGARVWGAIVALQGPRRAAPGTDPADGTGEESGEQFVPFFNLELLE